MSNLPLQEYEILEFARTRWRNSGPRDEAIRQRFGITSTRFFQLLNRIIDEPAAEVYDPDLVRRLRGRRASKASSRPGRVVTRR